MEDFYRSLLYVFRAVLILSDLGRLVKKGRPTHLTLSPSDGALKSSAKAVVNIPEEGDEDRGHMSEVCKSISFQPPSLIMM